MNPITAVWPGRPYPRGATWDGEGVNFALFSENAHKVEEGQRFNPCKLLLDPYARNIAGLRTQRSPPARQQRNLMATVLLRQVRLEAT